MQELTSKLASQEESAGSRLAGVEERLGATDSRLEEVGQQLASAEEWVRTFDKQLEEQAQQVQGQVRWKCSVHADIKDSFTVKYGAACAKLCMFGQCFFLAQSVIVAMLVSS